MRVILNGKAAESPLVNMSVSSCLMMGMVTLSVSQCDPTNESPHTAIVSHYISKRRELDPATWAPISRADVWVILRELIVHQLGVDRDEVTKEANFVTDLGCE